MFFSQYFSFPCQYHSTIAPYPFIHLPPTLYNVFLPVLQFPLSVPFHHCSIPVHPSARCSYQKVIQTKYMNLAKGNVLLQIRQQRTAKSSLIVYLQTSAILSLRFLFVTSIKLYRQSHNTNYCSYIYIYVCTMTYSLVKNGAEAAGKFA